MIFKRDAQKWFIITLTFHYKTQVLILIHSMSLRSRVYFFFAQKFWFVQFVLLFWKQHLSMYRIFDSWSFVILNSNLVVN